MFGWQFAAITPELREHLLTSASYWPTIGYSFVLLPFGVLVGLFGFLDRPKPAKLRLYIGLFILWVIGALIWILIPLNLETKIGNATLAQILQTTPDIIRNPTFAKFWITIGAAWLLIPLFVLVRWQNTPQIPYTWLLVCVSLGIILVQMTYWIGSQRYTTRYFYEALTAAALLSALPLAWLARRIGWQIVIGGLLLVSVLSLYNYSTPRIQALYRFNLISPELIEGVEARRPDERPVLVIVNGDTTGDNRVRWRSYGPLMTVTSPYLNSNIVAARDYGTSGMREAIVKQYPDYSIIEVFAAGNDAWFADEVPPG
jgi:hypothetical protein